MLENPSVIYRVKKPIMKKKALTSLKRLEELTEISLYRFYSTWCCLPLCHFEIHILVEQQPKKSVYCVGHCFKERLDLTIRERRNSQRYLGVSMSHVYSWQAIQTTTIWKRTKDFEPSVKMWLITHWGEQLYTAEALAKSEGTLERPLEERSDIIIALWQAVAMGLAGSTNHPVICFLEIIAGFPQLKKSWVDLMWAWVGG